MLIRQSPFQGALFAFYWSTDEEVHNISYNK